MALQKGKSVQPKKSQQTPVETPKPIPEISNSQTPEGLVETPGGFPTIENPSEDPKPPANPDDPRGDMTAPHSSLPSTQSDSYNQLEERYESLKEKITSQVINTQRQEIDTLKQQLDVQTQEFKTIQKELYALKEQFAKAEQQRSQQTEELHHTLSIVKLNTKKLADATNQKDEIPQYRYIIQASERMFTLLHQVEVSPGKGQSSLLEATMIACDTLRNLLVDEDFNEAVYGLAEAQNLNPREFRNHIRSLDHCKEFLELERTILIRAGVSRKLRGRIIEYLNYLASELIVAARKEDITPNRIFAAVQELSNEICQLQTQLKKQQTSVQRKKWAKKMFMVLAGPGLIVLNYSPITMEIGLDPGGSALSGTIGALLLDRGTEINVLERVFG